MNSLVKSCKYNTSVGQVAERPSLNKKQNAPSPTTFSSAGDFHEMKTGGIVVCSCDDGEDLRAANVNPLLLGYQQDRQKLLLQ